MIPSLKLRKLSNMELRRIIADSPVLLYRENARKELERREEKV